MFAIYNLYENLSGLIRRNCVMPIRFYLSLKPSRNVTASGFLLKQVFFTIPPLLQLKTVSEIPCPFFRDNPKIVSRYGLVTMPLGRPSTSYFFDHKVSHAR
jgi:hypothetical protein